MESGQGHRKSTRYTNFLTHQNLFGGWALPGPAGELIGFFYQTDIAIHGPGESRKTLTSHGKSWKMGCDLLCEPFGR